MVLKFDYKIQYWEKYGLVEWSWRLDALFIVVKLKNKVLFSFYYSIEKNNLKWLSLDDLSTSNIFKAEYLVNVNDVSR